MPPPPPLPRKKFLNQKFPCQIPRPFKIPTEKRKQLLNNITQRMKTLEIECLCLFIHHIIWSHHESSDCFEYPASPSLNQATHKILAKFSYLKKSFDHPFTWTPEQPPHSPCRRGHARMFNTFWSNFEKAEIWIWEKTRNCLCQSVTLESSCC